MASQTTLWRRQLAECEAAAPGARPSWLRQAYARVYRFLLARYGERPAADPVEPSPAPLIDATEDLAGKPAKTPGQMQAVLKSIHAAQPAEREERGELMSDAAYRNRPAALEDIWVTVVVADDRIDRVACLEWLGEHGIETRLYFDGSRHVIQVRRGAADEAFALLDEAREMLRPPSSPPEVWLAPEQVQERRRKRTLQWLVMAFVIGIGLGYAQLVLWFDLVVVSEALTLSFVVLGAFIALFALGLLLHWIFASHTQH